MSTYLSQMVQNLEVEHNQIPVPVMKEERTFIQKGKICFQFKAIGNIALNGFSNKYEIHYPEEIMKFGVQQQELVQIIKKINKTAMENWPCLNCYYYGIGLSLITCCISYLIPHICITDSENFVKEELHIFNQEYFNPKGLEIGLRKNCFTSWIQINELPYKDKDNLSQISTNDTQDE
ncbi:hypothetical protein ABPG74_015089 [Tetrahymena malaccensis]